MLHPTVFLKLIFPFQLLYEALQTQAECSPHSVSTAAESAWADVQCHDEMSV